MTGDDGGNAQGYGGGAGGVSVAQESRGWRCSKREGDDGGWRTAGKKKEEGAGGTRRRERKGEDATTADGVTEAWRPGG